MTEKVELKIIRKRILINNYQCIVLKVYFINYSEKGQNFENLRTGNEKENVDRKTKPESPFKMYETKKRTACTA